MTHLRHKITFDLEELFYLVVGFAQGVVLFSDGLIISLDQALLLFKRAVGLAFLLQHKKDEDPSHCEE